MTDSRYYEDGIFMPHTRRTRWRRKVYQHLPPWLRNHDFELFAAVLSVFAGLPLVFGRIQPTSIEALLPSQVVFLWALCLCTGGVSIIWGIIKHQKTKFPDRAFWMRLEALGLTSLAYSSYVYALCILLVTPTTGWSAAMLVIAFGLTCHTREIAIQLQLADFRAGVGLNERH